jgi:hypothetical protein
MTACCTPLLVRANALPCPLFCFSDLRLCVARDPASIYHHWGDEEVPGLIMRCKQFLNLIAKLVVAIASRCEKRGSFGWSQLEGSVKGRLELLAGFSVHWLAKSAADKRGCTRK